MGVDLTIFSGGKGLRGPQSSGLVLGRQDLIDACAANANPIHGVGRPMKVSKEVIAGIVTAVELWSVEEFEQAEMRRFEEQVDYVSEELSRLPGVTAVRGEASSPPGLPEANVQWDVDTIGKTADQVGTELVEGEPGIFHVATSNGVAFNPLTLQPGEEQAIVSRMRQILTG
jgi:L-seryl-tRNA(Ser) seleniumtransferase